ncbi:hypothetical protein BDP81DRAFT_23659 [Colletotrichum phormii]|uniref:Uncharacterized protein n=1 Tax=Colletotrichum phormii TaxID=359342 RepID=A0AAJ0EF30_9PEZI|nr:uncharacterized protein BDP81DRAFT_23659 [Colletotrichum phormii]KAK1636503.1 hypothetical protein BDP81DRAFT_23659 [Colletotrichum phormii]
MCFSISLDVTNQLESFTLEQHTHLSVPYLTLPYLRRTNIPYTNTYIHIQTHPRISVHTHTTIKPTTSFLSLLLLRPPRPLLSFLSFLSSLFLLLFPPLRLVSPPLPSDLNNIGCPDIRNLYLIKAIRLPSSFGALPKVFPTNYPGWTFAPLEPPPPAELRPHPSRCTVVYTKLAQSWCCNSQFQGARAKPQITPNSTGTWTPDVNPAVRHPRCPCRPCPSEVPLPALPLSAQCTTTTTTTSNPSAPKLVNLRCS